MRRMSPRAGTTTVELAIAAALLLSAMGAVLSTASTTLSLWGSMTRTGRLEEGAARLVDGMVEELRFADRATLVLTEANGSARLDFRVPVGFDAADDEVEWSGIVTYQVAPSPFDADANGLLDEWQLLRVEGGATRIVADRVRAGGFTASFVDDRLELSLSLAGSDRGRALTALATTAVAPRNRSEP